MGLPERRAQKAYETNVFPQQKQRIDEAAHFEVPVEVQWETLMEDDYSHLFESAWTTVYIDPLVEAFKGICIDDMGQEALKEKLKKVVIQNKAENASASRIARFEDGVLTLDHKPFTNIDDEKDRTQAIQKTLEAAL
ncbi:hypothetical protein [Corallococcus macrosporus]|uniref:Uncharacterized protein n=1 Tax=Myxococcus fulvus (strain ATCC BAA-855 / HW-1) TaxID=483219 RepID=F8CCN7_MYXFH|nr:hypothetical protein [Corallococcus macrosporus]AEI62291.1 hypothetical protein LILAB_01810 [Corallococcus macrosporus]